MIRPRPDADTSADAVRLVAHGPPEGAGALVSGVQGWLADGAVAVRDRRAGPGPRPAAGPATWPWPRPASRCGLDPRHRRARAHRRPGRAGLPPPRHRSHRHGARRPGRGLPPAQPRPAELDHQVVPAGRSTVAGLAAIADRLDDAKVAAKVEQLADDLGVVAAARTGTTREVLEVVRDGIGLGEAMELLDRSKGGEGSSQLDDLEALLQVADLHPDAGRVRAVAALGRCRARGPRAGGVTLSTVHRVKGREWDRRGRGRGHRRGAAAPPGRRRWRSERRVLHVAITRARHRVRGAGRRQPAVAVPGRARRARPRTAPPRRRSSAPAPGHGRRGASTSKGEGGRAPKGDPLEGDGGRPGGAPQGLAPRAQPGRRRPRLRRRLRRHPPRHRPTGPHHPPGAAACPGIGPAKLDKYGESILALI